ADVLHDGQVGVVLQVPLAEHVHPEPSRLEVVAVPYHADLQRQVGQLGGDGLARPHLQVGGGGGEPVDVQVVGVLVGDEHRVGAVEHRVTGERAGVDDEDLPVLLQPYAGVPVLREL